MRPVHAPPVRLCLFCLRVGVMSEATCPICAERCRRLRDEYRDAKAKKSTKRAAKALKEAKKAGCAWAHGKGTAP